MDNMTELGYIDSAIVWFYVQIKFGVRTK